MINHSTLSLNHAGPSTLSQARSKELLGTTPPPSWHAAEVDAEDDEGRLEGSWWTIMGKDDAYTAGLPTVPSMAYAARPRSPRIPKRKKTPKINGHSHLPGETSPPPLDHSKAVNLESAIHHNIDRLNDTRKVMGLIHDWQRIEVEGGALPPKPELQFAADKAQAAIQREERKRLRLEESSESNKRRKLGGEVGEKQAAQTLKKASAGLLAHAGFEGEFLPCDWSSS